MLAKYHHYELASSHRTRFGCTESRCTLPKLRLFG